ncbi:zinc-binding dehydrogenase [Prauserella cavernicola]|uniref:Zinc-binding dehydrogenase n=1 Tax=Prauserella cavernicola TaxID=2800127 RepID=A0A934QPS6_9PSEU|nr:zinc-binding dehydrogenase [Prauserella cavernicola]MBK1785962.1 zinc-binding dehydrogenase [Prauserella cavernicola]
MRAVLTVTGPRWEIARVPRPVPAPGEVLVRVRAAGLNRADALMREGGYVPDDAGWTVGADRVGFEFAGEVVEPTGDWAAGDAVVGQAGGTCAEFVTLDHRLLLPRPAGWSWTEAAALPSALLTEYDALTRGGFGEGDAVLVVGATSGVGLFAVGLAAHLGASRVTGTTRRPERAPAVLAAGADDVLVLPGDTTRAGFDVVLDHVGGDTLAAVLPLAAPRARVVQIGRLGGATTTLDLELLARNRLSLIGTTFRGRTLPELARLADAVRPHLAELPVRPLVDSTFPLTEPEAAFARLSSPELFGKVVVTAP